MRRISFGTKHAIGWLKYGQARAWIAFGMAFLAFLASVVALLMVID